MSMRTRARDVTVTGRCVEVADWTQRVRRGVRGLVTVATLVLGASAALAAGARASAPVRAFATPARQAADSRPDTVDAPRTGQEGLYARPFIGSMGGTSIGGYAEAHGSYFREDGISEGVSLEFRRFNLFVFSAISPRVRLISELEFEHGVEEIALETALIDLEVAPFLVLRGGILLPPVGYFNINHDSPQWDFVDRPIVSTEIIPSTLSEVGFGGHGRFFLGGADLTWDLYLTNGLQDGVVLNETGRTRLADGKAEGRFEGDNNGSPALTGRVAGRWGGLGELGLSFYRGAYNTFRIEGDEVDERRDVRLTAVDLGLTLGPLDVRGEAARLSVDVPPDVAELFGEEQWGAHLDLGMVVWRPRIPPWEDARVGVHLRLEGADFNVGTFSSTGREIGDEVWAVVPGVSFRPTPSTVFRANYRRHWSRDLVRNPTVHLAGLQVGFATYF